MLPTITSRARLIAHGRPLSEDASEVANASGYFAAAAADAVLPDTHDENAVLTRSYSRAAVSLAVAAAAAHIASPETMMSRALSNAAMVIRGGSARSLSSPSATASGPDEPAALEIEGAADVTGHDDDVDGDDEAAATAAAAATATATSTADAPAGGAGGSPGGRGGRVMGRPAGVAPTVLASRSKASAASRTRRDSGGGTTGPAWGRPRTAVGTVAQEPSSRLYDPETIAKRRASVEIDRDRMRIASAVFGGSPDWYERAVRAKVESAFRRAEILELRAMRTRDRAYIAAAAKAVRDEAYTDWQWEQSRKAAEVAKRKEEAAARRAEALELIRLKRAAALAEKAAEREAMQVGVAGEIMACRRLHRAPPLAPARTQARYREDLEEYHVRIKLREAADLEKLATRTHTAALSATQRRGSITAKIVFNR